MKKLLFSLLFFGILVVGYMQTVRVWHLYSQSESLPLKESELEEALDFLAHKVGVPSDVLSEFYYSYRAMSLSFVEPQESDGTEIAKKCTLPLQEKITSDARKFFLTCLTNNVDALFQGDFYTTFTATRVSLSQQQASIEKQMALTLLSWIEDLIRESMLQEGKRTYWYDHKRSTFLQATQPSEFPYQDGDIVIGFGSSAISALIAGVMDPHRGYSHAMMIRKSAAGELTLVDAQIESGVTEKPLQKLDISHYDQLLVLRLDPSTPKYEQIVKRAAELAKKAAEENIPYDEKMDADEHSKIFCSELVGYCYAGAASEVLKDDLHVKDIGPSRAKVRSARALAYLNILGVENEHIPSPGDLVTSQYLKVVADYRNMDDPLLYWNVLLAGEAFIAGIEAGHQVRVDPYEIWPLVTTACLFDKPLWLLGTILDQDLQIIPGAVSCDAAKVIKTHSDKIHDRLLRVSRSVIENHERPANLRDVSPWFLYAAMQRELQDASGVGWYFPHK